MIAALPVQQSALSARALRARMLASASVPYQGYVNTTANLGLPNLPDLADVSGLLDGSTNQYVWYRSPARWRADDVTGTGEKDIYQAGQLTYLWNFGRNLLTEVIGAQPIRLPRAADLLPPALARRLLGIAAATGHYARLPSRRVAGIPAAGLRVTPDRPGTTIGAVDFWADPRSGLPVEVEVFGRGASQPVLTTSFLELSQRSPALSVVTPHPAAAVGITSARLPNVDSVLNADGDGDHDGTPFPAELGGRRQAALPGAPPGVAIYGSGFARFVLLPLPRSVNASALDAAIGAGADVLSVGGQTGALIRTPLITVLLIRAGFRQTTYMFTGAVTPALLEQAAAGLVSDLRQRQ